MSMTQETFGIDRVRETHRLEPPFDTITHNTRIVTSNGTAITYTEFEPQTADREPFDDTCIHLRDDQLDAHWVDEAGGTVVVKFGIHGRLFMKLGNATQLRDALNELLDEPDLP